LAWGIGVLAVQSYLLGLSALGLAVLLALSIAKSDRQYFGSTFWLAIGVGALIVCALRA
jgi:hypothetical protein